jgi:hypothetical protein
MTPHYLLRIIRQLAIALLVRVVAAVCCAMHCSGGSVAFDAVVAPLLVVLQQLI